MVWELAQQAMNDSSEVMYDSSEVMYDGVYEPLLGVSMSREPQLLSEPSFRDRDWLLLSVLPLIGAGLGATVGFVLGKRGFVLTRKR